MLKAEEKIGYIYKQAILNKLKDSYKNRSNLIAANFNKVNAKDLNELRQSLLDNDAKLFFTKVSLFERFFKNIKKDSLLTSSLGPAGLIFVGDDIVPATKVLAEFAKEHEAFKLLGAFSDKKQISPGDLDHIAKLPTRDQLIAQAVMTIKMPLIKLRGVFEQLMRKLLLCLISAKEGKEKQGKKEEK